MNDRDKEYVRAAFFVGAFAIAVCVVILGIIELFVT